MRLFPVRLPLKRMSKGFGVSLKAGLSTVLKNPKLEVFPSVEIFCGSATTDEPKIKPNSAVYFLNIYI